jgi:hypothetical protein
MKESPKTTTKDDCRDEENCEKPGKCIAPVDLTTSADQINDTCEQTNSTDAAANHLKGRNFTLLQVLPVDRNVF